MTNEITHARYAQSIEPWVFTRDDVAKASESLSKMGGLTDLEQWTYDRTEIHTMPNDRKFRMIVDTPENGDKSKAVVVAGEFGNGATQAVAARARIVRDMVAPEATLIIQPNSTAFSEDNMNLSRKERLAVRDGSVEPFLGRIATVLGTFKDDITDLSRYGPSQGAPIVLGFGASNYAPDATAVAVLEAPNVVEKKIMPLVTDFMTSGNQLEAIIGENFDDPKSPLGLALKDQLTLPGFVRFGLGAVTARNRVIRGVMRHATAEGAMKNILARNGSVVHAWGDVANVSPKEANRAIAANLASNYLYKSYEFNGSDHSVTNNYALGGALARHAHNLLRR